MNSALLWMLGGAALIAVTIYVVRWRWWLSTPLAHLEVTPPRRDERSLAATAKLFTALHGLSTSRSWRERVLHQRDSIACELIATKRDGIRFVISLPTVFADTAEQSIEAYLPSAKVKRISDPLQSSKVGRTMLLNQRKHYAYPLQSFDIRDGHDPISYLASGMTKLEDDELMALQLVLRATHVPEASKLSRAILKNDNVLHKLERKHRGVGTVIDGINSLLFGVLELFSKSYQVDYKEQYQTSKRDASYNQQVAKGIRPMRTLSYFEHELVESVQEKLASPLHRATIRLYVSSADTKRRQRRVKNVMSAVQLFNVPHYQQLDFVRPRFGLLKSYRNWSLEQRRISRGHQASILSSSELAALFHVPDMAIGQVDNMIHDLSRTLPAHVSLKRRDTLDIYLGENRHHGVVTPIGLTAAERERHVYIIGGTGNGKTTMMLYAIVQDIKNGKGLAIIDPHGDLAETILDHVPTERIDDVVYINPDDLSYPVGINLLEMNPGLSGDDLLREKDLITESVISVLRKLFSEDDSGGHRIEYILRNTIQTALTMKGPTLFTIFRLLNDTKYRKQVVKELDDQDLKTFWQNELGKAGDFQKVKMAAGITAKIGRFLFSASAKRILEQEKSTVDFEKILNEGKILVCNFSKGLLGEDTSTLFGTTVLAKLQVAALRRARIQQEDRKAFHLYVDEFQNFATMSFVQMLSESRKYKLYLTMAEQSTQQQEQQRMVDIILANVGTVVCFRSGSPADERMVLPLFSPFIEQGEIANLPSFNFYMRIAAIEAKEPMSGVTLVTGSESFHGHRKEIVESTHKRYAVKHDKTKQNEADSGKQANNTTDTKAIKRTARQLVITQEIE
jgi:hypothetical protein